MDLIIDLLDRLRYFLRGAFVVVLIVTAALVVAAWLVRSKRLSPFSPLGRFARKVTDPLLDPVDQMILRAGGTGTATPLWAFVIVFFGGAVLMFLVTVVRDAAWDLDHAAARGAGGLIRLAVSWVFTALQLALLVRVLTSWLGGTASRIGRLAAAMTEWFLAPLRNVLPPFGNLDLSPLVAWFLLSLVRMIVMRAL